MPRYPGCFFVVNLDEGAGDPGGIDLDIGNLNVAVAMHEDDPPISQRFTTWGLGVDSAVLYQTMGDRNKLIVGDAGRIYYLTEDENTDDGVPIRTVYQSGPLPEVDADVTAESQKRIHEFWWQTADDPPSSGWIVVVTFIDADSRAAVVRRVTQASRKMRVPVGLRCRQFLVRIEVTTATDFAPIAWGIRGQVLGRPNTIKK